MTDLFYWIVKSGYFGKVEISASIHDELNCIYPEEISDFPAILEKIMENAAAMYCKSLPIPAVAEVADYWKH